MPHKQEEWPTLSPDRSSKSVTPENCAPEQNLLKSASPTSIKLGQVERFPISGALSHPTPSSQGHSVTRVTLPQQTQRTQASMNPPTSPDAPDLSKDERKTVPDGQILSGVSTVTARQPVIPDLSSDFRRSSIPVSRHSGFSAISQSGTQQSKTISNDSDHVGSAQNHPGEHKILKDCIINHPSPQPVDTVVKIPGNREDDNISERNSMMKPLSGLEAIEESPKPDVEVRRLSVASSSGPTLKIFKSAEKVIMGTSPHTEIFPGSHQRKNTRPPSVETNSQPKVTLPPSAEMNSQQQHLQNGGSLSVVTNQLVDSSGLGISLKSSRRSRLDEETKQGTAKIEDVSYSLPTNHLRQLSAKSKTPALRKTDTFCADDPFFDGRSRITRGKDRSSASTEQLSMPKDSKEEISIEGELSVTPLLGKTVDGLNGRGKPKTTEKQCTTRDQSYIDSGLSPRHPCITEIPRDAPDSISSKGVIISSKNANTDLPAIPAPALRLGMGNRHVFPPRSSSRTMPTDYTISAKPSPITSSVILEPLQSAEYSKLYSGQRSSITGAPAQLNIADGELKRDSVANESNKSHESTSKGMISNIRGLFHKRASDTSSSSSAKPVKKNSLNVATARGAGSFAPLTDIHPAMRPSLASTKRSTRTGVRVNLGDDMDTPASLSPASPFPSDNCPSMALAMRLLNSVRNEENSPQKERVLKLGAIMVDAITQVREAEKAVEEAKQAMRKAELAHMFCKRGVREIAGLIEQWTDDMGME